MIDTECPYCGTDYTPSDGVSDEYMWEGHIIMDCTDAPTEVHERMNKPWVQD